MSDDICTACGATGFRPGEASRTFCVNDRIYMIERIPARLCVRCAEPVFSAEVAERVRKMIHGPHRTKRVIEAEVLEFEAA